MKKQMWLLVLLACVASSSAANYNYDINTTQLPYNRAELIGINYTINHSLNVVGGNYTSSNTSILNFVDSQLQEFYIFANFSNLTPGNYTDSIKLFDTENNFTSFITFAIQIINDTKINQTNFTEFVQIDINEFEYNICDYFQPWNRTKQMTIAGREGQTIYTDFDAQFFSAPTSFVIPASNTTLFDIQLHVNNLTVGTYIKVFKFSVVSNFSEVTFHFNVEKCIRQPPTYDEMIKVCSIIDKTPEENLQCLKLQAEYQRAVYEAALDASEARYIQNDTVRYVNVTQRVPVLDLNDPEISQAIKDIPTVWKQMQIENRDKDKKIEKLQSDLNQISSNNEANLQILRNESQRQLTESLRNLVGDNTEKSQQIKDYEENYIPKSKIYTWISLGVIIALCVFGYFWYNENMFW